MKNIIAVCFGIVSTLALAHYGVYVLGQVKSPHGNTAIVNPNETAKIRTVEFANLGESDIIITHMRFYGSQSEIYLTPDELTIHPGESVKEMFSEYPVLVDSMEFNVRGTTNLLEVRGIID